MTTEPVNVRLRFFARARDLAGGLDVVSYQCDSPIVRVGELVDKFSLIYNLESIKDCIVISHNQVFCLNIDEEIHLQENDEIAVIPPISGG